jgi:hypothetical protein
MYKNRGLKLQIIIKSQRKVIKWKMKRLKRHKLKEGLQVLDKLRMTMILHQMKKMMLR